MKTNWFLATAAVLWGVAATALGQFTSLHRFLAIDVKPDHTISLSLTSGVPSTLRNYYDLFPIEASQNLVDWEPLVTLMRTNRSTNATLFLDLAAANHALRFYRTATKSRTNRYVKTNSSFMVSVWYPAEPVAGILPAFHTDPNLYNPGGCISSSSCGLRSHSIPGVPVTTNESKYPLVIYAHGHLGTRTDNTRKVENLVSHGFIVLALDHINCGATVFPDGRIFHGMDAPNLGTNDPITMSIATNRAEDVRFVLDEAARWNTEDPMLKGSLDLDRVGIFGHSFGGGTSAAACAQEPRIKAGLSLDGGFVFFPIPAFDRSFLFLSGGDSDAFMQPYRNAYRNLFDRLTGDAYWVHIKNSTHCDFTDTPWFDSPTSTTVTRRALVQDLYVVSFFRKYLRGKDDHFLDGTPPAWPEVNAFLKK
ncbi:MAG: hypothetical protein DME23_22950 [Verrucomicrobia bacterium]|nr:MAG: hypothetical protein DME23_22950 [Verrucomicrobiota bacterium]